MIQFLSRDESDSISAPKCEGVDAVAFIHVFKFHHVPKDAKGCNSNIRIDPTGCNHDISRHALCDNYLVAIVANSWATNSRKE